MDRQTRRTYFERLCDLRNDYQRLDADDITSVISVEAMIELANGLFDRPSSPLIAMIERGAKTV
jgi:hypothetical protein